LINNLPVFPSQYCNITTGASIDACLLANAVTTYMQEGFLVDVGCGNGIVGIIVALKCPGIHVLGIDTVKEACSTTEKKVIEYNLLDRFSIINGDALQMAIPKADAICSNPPLLPGEIGFLSEISKKKLLFWAYLVERLSEKSLTGNIFLHLFDFHGIFTRTGAFPCLREVANEHNFELRQLYQGSRPVSSASKIRKSLPHLADFFPEGTLLINGHAETIKDIVSLGININKLEMEVCHSIFHLVK
jgi:hypothetical protein